MQSGSSEKGEPGLWHLVEGAAPVVQGSETVLQACEMMRRLDCGAVAVMREGRLEGILTEGDVVTRVVLANLAAGQTPVHEVMTTDVESLSIQSSRKDVVAALIRNKFRHVPLCDEAGTVVALLSGASLFRREVGRLGDELDSLESFLSADGIGG